MAYVLIYFCYGLSREYESPPFTRLAPSQLGLSLETISPKRSFLIS